MKFSIVTISKNQGTYIEKCLDSVIKQQHYSYEHIIIDANSNDNTYNILKNYSNKNQIIEIGSDKGPSDGLNKGFNLAKGEIFYFLNADDYLLPGTLERVEAEFDQNKELQMVIAPIVIVNKDEKIISKKYPGFAFPKKYVNEACVIFQQGFFFKSCLYKKTPGFNIDNNTNWDGELLIELLSNITKKNISRIDHEAAAFRIHQNSITGANLNKNKYEENKTRLFKKVYGERKNKNKLRKLIYLLIQIITDPKWFYFKIKYLLKYKF